jgi:hypothetical protein
MEIEEYYEIMDEITKPFKDRNLLSIKGFIFAFAYEKGHSGGYEEIINHARSLAFDLERALKDDGLIK